MALHLCASAGQNNGFGALRKSKTGAPYASDDPMLIYIRVNVCGGGPWGGVIRCIGCIGFG